MKRFFAVSPPVSLGMRRAFPVVCGYMPVGFAFGVLAVQNGISPLYAVMISLFVYAGSAQLIAAGMFGAGAPMLSIILTTFMVNLRHVLMSTALCHWLSHLPRPFLVLFGLELTDETFALHSRAMQQGEKPVKAQLLACNMTAHLGWILSTALGAFMGELLGDTKPYGLDFTLPAMFIVLLVPQLRERLYFLAALAAGALSVIFMLSGAGRWNVMLATLITASLGTWIASRHAEGKGSAA